MTRSRAALTHLWPSLLLLASLAGLIFLAWYPYPFRHFEDSGRFALALILTAGFIGPAMTWLVYSKGKRGLLLDLVIITVIQLAAVAWGAMALYQNRPYFMVFTLDRFEVLSGRDVDSAWITNPKFLEKPFSQPILLSANMPEDPAAYQKFLREVMFEGQPDLQFRPEFWSLYDEARQLALKTSRPLGDLRDKRAASAAGIDRLVERHGGDIRQFRFVPALMKDAQFTVILDARNGDVVDALMIDPWLE